VVTSNNITDKTKKPLENAVVDIYNRKGQKVESLLTNAKGQFTSGLTTGLQFGQKLDYYAVVSAEVHTTDTFDIKATLKGD
jgi:hypothetical protein